ncbi:MAG: oxygen-insensitive NADPH nitroreductase [Thiolinea sp.]
MNPVMETMLNHRSVRKYTDEAISDEMLASIVQCGQAAATSSFIQAYSIINVSDTEHRAKIAAAAGGQVWVEKAARFLVLCADLKRIDHCCQQQGMGDLEGQTEHFLAASVDVGLMAQNMMLAAESLGLGCVFIGGIRNDPIVVSELLELPDQVYPAFGMCLGWPDQQTEVKPRLPVEVVLHEGKYCTGDVPEQVAAYDQAMSEYYQARSSNQRVSNWSEQTAAAVQKKKREHMLAFLQGKGFLRK